MLPAIQKQTVSEQCFMLATKLIKFDLITYFSQEYLSFVSWRGVFGTDFDELNTVLLPENTDDEEYL